MKTHCTVGLAILAGFGLGAVAIHGLHAQAKPPAIVVVDISDVTDPDGFKAITQRANANTEVTAQMGGRYIARTGKITALDGAAPKRFIIIHFDSAEQAQAWHNSPDQKKVDEIRAKTTQSRSFLVEGM